MKVEYSQDKRLACFDGFKFRKDLKTGYFLATRKTDGVRRERLHCYVWRYYNGDIPDGYHIHHVDGDKDYNDIQNLKCVKEHTHLKYHSSKRAIEHYDEIRENLIKNAAPKAAEWHSSDEGRRWHSEHAKRITANLSEKEFVCKCCGKHFLKKPLGQNKYCSNACRTKARYQSGVDNETRHCVICGGEFVVNRYANKKTCSPQCAHKLCGYTRSKENRQSAGI